MTRIWVASDHHFGHRNILTFKNDDGTVLRPFSSLSEMHHVMVERHNQLVKPEDHVYFLGDFAINRPSLLWALALNGHKRLVRGNHDIFKTSEYLKVGFQEIYGVRVFAKPHFLIFSHIPLHPACLKSRNWTNIHGHLHGNTIKLLDGTNDPMYRSVCVEQIDYKPVLLME